MAVVERKRDIAIRVMVTAKEQAEIRKAANKAAMPMSVYVRAKALEAARAAEPTGWARREPSAPIGDDEAGRKIEP